MTDVKRYRATRPGDTGHGVEGILGISSDGERAALKNMEWVAAENYDELAQECDRLRTENATLERALRIFDPGMNSLDVVNREEKSR